MSFNNSTSSTDVSAVPVASWTYLSCIFTVATILSIFCNGVLILFFITDRDLRTPFNIYMINVLTANFLCSCVQNPLEVVNNIYPNFWLGPSVCTLYQYGAYVLQAGISGGHILIAVNRTWAVLHPISYRSIHSKRVAVLLCAGMWCYIHVVLLPGIIRDALYFRMDMASNSCYLDSAAQRSWAIAVQVVIFNNPQLIMLTSLSIVVIMRYIRAGKKLSRRVEPTSIPGKGVTNTDQKKNIMAQVAVSQNGPGEGSTQQDVATASNAKPTAAKRESNAYTMLAMLTFSAVVCWTPLDAYYTVEIFTTVDYPLFYQVAAVLHAFQVVLDPVAFAISSPVMRVTLRRMVANARKFLQ